MASRPVPGTRVRKRVGGSPDSGARWIVRADDLGALRALVTASVGAGPVASVEVRVDTWRRPNMGWTGQPGIAGVDQLSVRPTAGAKGGAKETGVEVELVLRAPLDAAVVLSSIVRTLQPTVSGFPSPTWVPGISAAGVLAEHVRDVYMAGDEEAHVRRADVLLAPAGVEMGADRVERIVHVQGERWGDREVRIDPTIHRPHGRASDHIGDVWTAQSVLEHYRSGVRMSDVPPLRSVSAVTDASSLPASLHAQLSALGVVLVETEADLPARDDLLGWQRASVNGRRDALRDFSPWPAAAPWPTVSVLLSTHRPERLPHALSMVRRQNYPYLQVIVALHGDEDDVARHAPEIRRSLEGWDGEWAVIGVPSERTLGHALAAASARADGELLTKMDDDDFYAAEHVWDLVLARMYSGAQIVGKALDWIYLSAADTTVFRPTYPAERFAKFVAGGTMLISAGDLAQVGGWRPVPRSVDRALLDRVLAAGGLVYRTHGLGYVYVRNAADGSANTSSVHEDHFLTKTVAHYPGLVRSVELGTQEPQARGPELS